MVFMGAQRVLDDYRQNHALSFPVGQAFPFDVAQGGEPVEPQPGGKPNRKGVGLESPTYGTVNNSG